MGSENYERIGYDLDLHMVIILHLYPRWSEWIVFKFFSRAIEVAHVGSEESALSG